MDFIPHSNLTQFLSFCARIKPEIRAWKLVNVSLGRGSGGSIFYIAKKMKEALSDMQGEIFICNSRELLCLVKAGEDADVPTLQKKIQAGFTEYECHVEVVDTTREGLQKIELRLKQDMTAESLAAGGAGLLLKERQKREENVILLADDDMFMRSLVKKGVDGYGTLHERETGEAVVDTYLQVLPDIVFLDIHMPGKSGIDILEEILMFDQNAFIVMLSADSAKDNVLETKKLGAKGFIAKPFTKEKLVDMLQKCPTIR
jgi:two-component system chemotaxis response regulator CheY